MTETIPRMADIIPYVPEYSRVVRSWIECEETYYNLSRSHDFPPPPEIVDTWQRKNIYSYLLVADSKPLAYGELWWRPAQKEIEIGHLLVDPIRRYEGWGTTILELLFERASHREGISKVVINLYTESQEALGCYLKAGFELIGTTVGIPGLRMIRVVTRIP